MHTTMNTIKQSLKPYDYELNIQDLPSFSTPSWKTDVVHQILSYIERLIHVYKHSGKTLHLMIPSPSALADFFRCSELDVLETFHELELQGYQYQLESLEKPVLLHIDQVYQASIEEENTVLGIRSVLKRLFSNLLGLPHSALAFSSSLGK
jgi:hypothetical protein